MTNSSLYIGAGCLLVTSIIYYRKLKSNSRNGPLPPGPKPIPVLGNLRDLQAAELWVPAKKWAKEFGEVVYLHVFGQGIIFINSAKAASDLLEKRGAIYADKPQFTMLCELCNCKNMVAFTAYGEQSKRQRKLMHKAFALQQVPNYHPFMTNATAIFLTRLVASPSEFRAHVRRYAGSLTLNVVYGYEVNSNDDPFLIQAEEAVETLSVDIAGTANIWAVDLIPALAKLPENLPGMSFKRKAKVWRQQMQDWVDAPFEYVKNAIKSGTAKHSFCSSLMEDENLIKSSKDFEYDLKWTANSMYGASIDTTVTTIMQLLLALMDHPEVLKKAQQEIDAVVGQDRLPGFEDRKSLPYVEAVLHETWRWGAPVPLGLPHRLTEDDVYEGKYLPKGSLIFTNIWEMSRDPELYPNPDEFNPDRWLEVVSPGIAKRRDIRNIVFGFGRRKCPGSDLVDSSAWLLVAGMLATLNISKPVDEAGNVIEPKVVFTNPVFNIPEPFECDIRPRSEQALALIRSLNL